MAVINLSDLIVMDGSASSILVGDNISVGDVICKPNIPGPALAYKANATADTDRYEVIGISVTTTEKGGQCFYVRRGAVVKCDTINNTGNDITYWLSTTDGKMGLYSDFDETDHVYMIAEAYRLKTQVKLTMVDFKARKETPLPLGSAKPEKPTLAESAVTSESITLTITPPAASESKVYKYILKQNNVVVQEGLTLTYTAPGLTPETEYTFKVAAVSNNGETYSDDLIVATLEE